MNERKLYLFVIGSFIALAFVVGMGSFTQDKSDFRILWWGFENFRNVLGLIQER